MGMPATLDAGAADASARMMAMAMISESVPGLDETLHR